MAFLAGSPLLWILFTLVIAVWVIKRQRTTPGVLPPSIPGAPIIGNTLQLANLTHIKLDEWKDKFGPIYSLNAMGKVIVVLANAKVASDILDKMSAITSDRPDWIMAGQLMSGTNLLSTQKYDDKWRRHRRGAHDALSPRASESFYPVQEEEALILVKNLIQGDKRDDLELNMRCAAASTVWRALYGGPPLGLEQGGQLSEINDIADSLLVALSPGGGIVDIIPALIYLPTALAPFKQYADRFYARANAFFTGLSREAIKRKGVSEDPSQLNLCASLDEKKKKFNLSDEDVAWISGMMFLGGAETTSTALQYFVLAMILYPEVAEKARKELDSVVSSDTPPTFADRERLPYIEALVKEIMRWRPVVAIGAPHVATQDVLYGHYTIPKGAMILNNLWSICRDPSLFPDPEEFRPERFLESGHGGKPSDPGVRFDDLAFGYGRRVCVGRYVAVNSLFIEIATLIWAFEFRKGVNSDGNEVTPPTTEFHNTGGTVRPTAFPFRLVPRSESVIAKARAVST